MGSRGGMAPYLGADMPEQVAPRPTIPEIRSSSPPLLLSARLRWTRLNRRCPPPVRQQHRRRQQQRHRRKAGSSVARAEAKVPDPP